MSREADNDTNDGVGETPTERLARETNTPLEAVTQIYEIETAELSRTARIKSYVDVLALHRTRVLLAEREESPPE
jgi:hypothetical protein